MKRALLLVDLQNDFMPGGALAVREGDQILPVVNDLLFCSFDLIIATKDWHPANHVSFYDNHPDKKIGDTIVLSDGTDQILWPRHCVQGSKGAEFAPGWSCEKVSKVICKGDDPALDSYSAFFDNDYQKSTGLENFLLEEGITDLYIAGLATDYCVKYSVFDARVLNFNTYVIKDACRGVNLSSGDSDEAFQDMENIGVHLISSDQV
jgi:nicotinamidase/pyrazinamidase